MLRVSFAGFRSERNNFAIVFYGFCVENSEFKVSGINRTAFFSSSVHMFGVQVSFGSIESHDIWFLLAQALDACSLCAMGPANLHLSSAARIM